MSLTRIIATSYLNGISTLALTLMCYIIIVGVYSDDGLFLRQLILDGHWDDTLEFLQPLEQVDGYDKKKCQYLIYKHKYLELLCIKHDPGPLQVAYNRGVILLFDK